MRPDVVSKLRRMTEGNGCAPNEAAAARRLLAKYCPNGDQPWRETRREFLVAMVRQWWSESLAHEFGSSHTTAILQAAILTVIASQSWSPSRAVGISVSSLAAVLWGFVLGPFFVKSTRQTSFATEVKEAWDGLPESLQKERRYIRLFVASNCPDPPSKPGAMTFGRCYTADGWYSGKRSRIEIFEVPHKRIHDPQLRRIEIQRTLIHELGHHLGLNHEQIASYGFC